VVVGFVDGEGCFSISVVRNTGCLLGWQVQHEFSVTQAAPSRHALELVQRVLEGGRSSRITVMTTIVIRSCASP
jgi:LAGLIDADG endonuclease